MTRDSMDEAGQEAPKTKWEDKKSLSSILIDLIYFLRDLNCAFRSLISLA